jgi:hypothetical protein
LAAVPVSTTRPALMTVAWSANARPNRTSVQVARPVAGRPSGWCG